MAARALRVSIKRIYEPAAEGDGSRVLVDRLWPRGLSKQRAALDVWLRDIAPSDALRKWFGHDPARWQEFQRRYRAELRTNPALGELRGLVKHGHVTLLYGARDELHNQAVALRDYLHGKSTA